MVLDAAFELFLEHGYEGTSMEAVARAIGVTKPVVYACYPSKDELFKALLAREEERVLGEIAAALPLGAEGDLEAALTEGLTGFLRAVEASPRAYRVIFLGEGANAAVARRIQRGRERQVEAVAMLARPLLGAADDPELDRSARLLGHLTVGLAESGARALLNEEGWTPESLGSALGRVAASGQASGQVSAADGAPAGRSPCCESRWPSSASIVFGAGIPFAVDLDRLPAPGRHRAVAGGARRGAARDRPLLRGAADRLRLAARTPLPHRGARPPRVEPQPLGRAQAGSAETNSIEDIAVAADAVVAVICTLWFLVFGDPGVPISP